MHMAHGACLQVGDLPRPGTAPVAPGAAPRALHLASAEALADAQRWVRAWPEARGATRLLPALQLSAETWRHTECLVVFSDGIIDDGGAALAFVEQARCLPLVVSAALKISWLGHASCLLCPVLVKQSLNPR
jgi:hypothetical protein